jgi:hypothetical protein
MRTLALLASLVILVVVGALVYQWRSQPHDDGIPRVVLVTLDGLRWQEVLTGADPALIDDAWRATFWLTDADERRRALMPFLWNVVAREGRILGNGTVTNGFNISYPGYNEMLTGRPDPRIDSNDRFPNRNRTVLEALSLRPQLQGHVAAFGSWDVIDAVLDGGRVGFPVNAGWAPLGPLAINDTLRVLDQVARETPRTWTSVRNDALTMQIALAYAKDADVRVLYVSLGETDERGHEKRYDLYLDAARRDDALIAALWRQIQADPRAKANTTLLITTDHGRGGSPERWPAHGKDDPDSARVWLAAIGRGVSPAPDDEQPFTSSQVAATVARLAGEDWQALLPGAAPPLPGIGAP